MSIVDAKVIVSTYEELPRRRRRTGGNVASSAATTRAKASAPMMQQQAGGYSRRALLLAYAQQLRRARRAGRQQQQQRGGPPLLLEWGKWKAADHPVIAGGDDVRTIGRRGWRSRLRCCVRLWIRSFLRRLGRIREDVSCNKGDQK
ncbi:hypothetical protein U9M48_010262 [Paspalum notatum var. saurae]|uniref:Uncharacterized protein n=1 Tax=Paspalum notatum var. saurae TaxID=547442 RepID=A0AAQ3ST74_PASNO